MAKEDEGYLLDGSGNRVLSGSGEAVRTGSYDDDKVTQNRRKAAEDKLAEDVQEKLKEDKAKAKAKDDADFDAEEARSKTARAVAGAATKAAPAEAAPTTKATPTKKAPIVTKEELAKSGLSLRDYMNKQKGLTRRDGSAPAKAPSKAQSAESTKSDFLASLDREAENRKNYVPRATPGARAPKQTTSKPAAKKPYMPEQPDMSYRKGGKINGIAKRGLTKCKMR